MQNNNFLVLKKLKNAESAQLWNLDFDTHYCELWGLMG